MKMNLIILSLLLWAQNSLSAPLCDEMAQQADTQRAVGDQRIFRVTAPKRLYFHTAPDSRCRMDNTFIIHGDTVRAYREYHGWLQAGYVTAQGDIVDGWLPLDQLTETARRSAPADEEVRYVRQAEEQNRTAPELTAADYQLRLKKAVFQPGMTLTETRRRLTEIYHKTPEMIYIGPQANSRTFAVDIPDNSVFIYMTEYPEGSFISQISLSDNTYATQRGIRTGDSLYALYEAYGLPDDISADDLSESQIYTFQTMKLIFDIDKNKQIARITYLLNRDK